MEIRNFSKDKIFVEFFFLRDSITDADAHKHERTLTPFTRTHAQLTLMSTFEEPS